MTQPLPSFVGRLTARSKLRAFALVCLVMGIASCGDSRPTHELAGRSMGTSYSIQVVTEAATAPDQALGDDIEEILDGIEGRLSTYIATSEVSRFNGYASDDWFPVSADTCELIERAVGWSRISGGAFDITLAPVVDAWGFGSAPVTGSPPTPEVIAALLANVGYHRLETRCDQPAIRKTRPGVAIDLSGFAKGYAVDAVAEELDKYGFANYLVEIGGELRASGLNAKQRPWTIAIENPLTVSARPAGIVTLANTAMATSGDYRNFFEFEGQRYSHTIDPTTGRPISHLLTAVTVLHSSAASADALATALLVLGPDRGMALAERLGTPARFLLREGTGFAVRDSSAFPTE